MFELKLTFATADDLYAAVAKLAGETVAAPAPLAPAQVANTTLAAIGETEAPVAEKKKPGRPRKEAPAPEPAVTSAATGASEQDPAPVAHQPEPEPEQAPAGGVPTTDDVKAAAEKVNAKVGIIELRKLLASFSAARISEVAEEDRAGFIAKALEICA